MDDFRLRNPISAFLCHSKRFRDELPGECALNFDGKFVEESLGVFREKDAQKLYNNELVDEIAILFTLEVFLPHKVHKLPDEFRAKQIQGCIDEGYYDCYCDLHHVCEDQVKE